MKPLSLRKHRKVQESKEISVNIGFIEWNKEELDIGNHSLDDYEDLGEVLEDE